MAKQLGPPATNPPVTITGTNRPLFEKMLSVLNEAMSLDPEAIHALMCNRVPCNTNLMEHPTIGVITAPLGERKAYAVGAMGLLNGVIEGATGIRIMMVWDDTEPPTFIGFREYTEEKK